MPGDAAPVKVFLADDSVMICDRVETRLVANDMAVVGRSPTPRGCIDGILASHPDVVVLDIQLEGGTGIQVLRAVRAAAPDIAFVIFSINASPAHRKLYLKEGAHSFLDKATDYERLVDAIRVAARHSR